MVRNHENVKAFIGWMSSRASTMLLRPEALRHAGRRRIGNRLTKLAPRMGERLADDIIEALGQQSMTVIGTNAATIVLPELAGMLARIHEGRATVYAQAEALVEAHPLHQVLMSLPAVGITDSPKSLAKASEV